MSGAPRQRPGQAASPSSTRSTPRTPQLRSAFPETPISNQRGGSSRLPNVQKFTSSVQESGGPLIPLSTIDAPSQRLYVAGFYTALLFWRLYDFYNLTVDETESLWLFMKWVAIDGVFLFGLPGLRIPWLEWSSITMTFLFLGHAFMDGVLMFRISVPLGAWVVALVKILYDRELSVSERYVKPASILQNPSLILGRTVVHILPEGSAVLNPDNNAYCLDNSLKTRNPVVLPIHINQTTPISIELIRFDLDSSQNETISIGSSALRKMRKHAEKGNHRHKAKGLVLEYSAKKTGLYKLQRVVDETKLEVQGRSNEALIVSCPTASISTLSKDRCKGDLSDLSLHVDGTPPLKVKYRKNVNGFDNDVSLQSIQPEEFATPLSRHDPLNSLTRFGSPDLTWATSHHIKVPLNQTLDISGLISYTIEQVTDALGNNVVYPASVDGDEKSKSKPNHLVERLRVHDHPIAYLTLPSASKSLKVAASNSIELPVVFKSSGKSSIENTTLHLSYLFTPESETSSTGDHSASAQLKDFTVEKPREKPKIQEPGFYTLHSVSTPLCPGEILEPASFILETPPMPSLVVESNQISDKCAGNPIGLRFNLGFTGTPPFRVNYIVKTKGDGQEYLQATSVGSRHQLDFKPGEAGHYTYIFQSITDALHTDIALKDLIFEQNVKPSVFAQFTKSSPRKNVCIDQQVAFDVKLQGEGPWTLEYEMIHAGRRTKSIIKDIENDKYKIVTDNLTSGGEYALSLISVTDKLGCKETLQQEAKFTVRQQKPRASFGLIEGKRIVQSLEQRPVALPLRLSGEPPWTLIYQDPSGKVHEKKSKHANDHMTVKEAGTFKLVSITDSQCPGSIDEQANLFNISLIARPKIVVPDDQVDAKRNSAQLSKQDICEGVEDALELTFTGRPPFAVKYTERKSPLKGSKSVHVRELNVPQQTAQIKLLSTQAGDYEYDFHELGDDNYEYDPKTHKPLIVRQKVHARPTAEFKDPSRTYSFCQGEGSDGNAEKIPVSLTGLPPFTLDIEVRHQNKASKAFTYTLRDVPGPKYDLSIPRSRLLAGNSALYIRQVRDQRGCERLLDIAVSPRVHIAVNDPPTIAPLETRSDYCVGDRVGFALSGLAPYTVHYKFQGKEKKASVHSGTFRRIAESSGDFVITGVQDAASTCRSQIDISKRIHPMPSVRLSKGRENRVDIHAGSEVDLTFDFGGTPPFEFTYTRSENSKSTGKGAKAGAVLETHTLTSETQSLTVKASEEGTYEVVAIKDAYCSFTKPGSEGLVGSGRKLLL